MNKSLAIAAFAASLSLAGAASTAAGTTSTPAETVASVGTPIKHVVIIYQENHSFDDTLGAYCAAATRTTPCNTQDRHGNVTGTPYVPGPVTFADGNVAPNVTEPDMVPNIGHSPSVAVLASQNKWDLIVGCKVAPYPCVTHIPPANIPNLTALADRYTVSDATFAAGGTVSFGAHVNLIGGDIDGFDGYNPRHTAGMPQGWGWGCSSNREVLWGSFIGQKQYVPSCIPDVPGNTDPANTGPFRPTPVPYEPTLFEQLEANGKTWHVYEDKTNPKSPLPSLSPYSVCMYFQWCLANRFTSSYNSPTNTLINAAQTGTLPDVSFALPILANSQHNNASMAVGDNYIGQVVAALQAGPEWSSTAVFITYDDCGCFYDHVLAPASANLGMRNPMVIVSPYAKPGYTDSVQASQPYSMLSFIDNTFGLPPLTPAVGNSYDYSGAFSFGGAPHLAPVQMTRTKISPAERAALKAAPDSDDVT